MKRKISIVVPSYNEQDNVKVLSQKIEEVLKTYDYEIIFVNDGSTDKTYESLIALSSTNKRIKYLNFSRNFGHQSALRAGLAYARGEAVVSMDADLQHPPELLGELIDKWSEGYDVVYTVRKDTSETGLFKRKTSKWFYKIINSLANLNIEEGAADFRLLDRKVVDVINSEKESNLFLRGYIDWIGFKQIGISYIPAKRFSGTSKYSLKKMIHFAASGITQFSTKPLHLAFVLSLVAFIACALYVVYAVWAALIAREAVPGWLSLVVLFVFLQGMQFLLIGLVGEYVGRTFMQTKNRPDYIISETNIETDKLNR